MKNTTEFDSPRDNNQESNNALFEKIIFLQNKLESLQNKNEILNKELKKKTEILNLLIERFDINPNSPFLQN